MDNRGQEELAELLAEAQSVADAVRHAYRPLPQVAEASDETGAVTVTVGDHGARVTRVAVAADWKNKIPAARLGMAVMEAVMSVQLGPFKDFFTQMPDSRPPGGRAAAPLPPPTAFTDTIAGLTWDDLGDMLNTAEKALDAVAAGVRGASPGDGKVAGRSDNRRVEVTMHGGQVASVTLDAKWAETANRQQLSDSLRQAFEDAYAAAAAPRSPDDRNASLIAEVRSALSRIGITPPPQPGKDHQR
ncbi:MAG: hypothetical protein ACM3ML_04085 [Micromonosporaceae bacterium]